MDYGRTPATAPVNSAETAPSTFFTAGVGNAPASENPLPDAENLNTSTWNTQKTEEPQPFAPHQPQKAPNLGEIVPLTPPPTIEPQKPTPFNENLIRTTGDRLDPAAVQEMNNLISTLDTTGNLADFYDAAREMTEVNLNNSFNRNRNQQRRHQSQNTGGQP